MTVIDGRNAVLGRLASHAAKALLKGEEIVIINAEKAIITGDKNQVLGKYLKLRSIGSPQHGPFYPKRPELIVRRTIRGMLPYKKSRGRQALKNLRVYTSQPEGVQGAKSLAKEIRTSYITVGDLARRLGWKE